VAASILAPVIWGAIDFLPTFSTDAAATSVCYDAYKYAGYVTTYFHNQGVYGDINYSSGDMELYDDLTDHGAIWIGDNSQSDSGAPDKGFDWIQDGYFVGSADGDYTTSTVVYAEINDYATGQSDDRPVATFFPDLGWGNQTFEAYYDETNDASGRGQFIAYDGTTQLDTSWMVDPTATQQEANTEAYLGNIAGVCPTFDVALIGTNGNQSNVQWTSSTETSILNDATPRTWVNWNPTYIPATSPLHDSPYTIGTFSNWDAMRVNGGGS